MQYPKSTRLKISGHLYYVDKKRDKEIDLMGMTATVIEDRSEDERILVYVNVPVDDGINVGVTMRISHHYVKKLKSLKEIRNGVNTTSTHMADFAITTNHLNTSFSNLTTAWDDLVITEFTDA